MADVEMHDNDDEHAIGSTKIDDVDLSRATNRVWLVKLPNFLADYWEQLPPNTPVGTVKIGESQPGDKPKVTLEVLTHLQKRIDAQQSQQTIVGSSADGQVSSPPAAVAAPPQSASIPKDYQVRLVSQPPGNMLIFSEKPESGAAIAIEGTVQYEFTVTPELNEDYRAIMRARRQQAETKTRSTQMLDSSAGDIQAISTISKRFMNTDTVIQRQKRRRAEEFRRDRLPREQVAELILKAFQTHPHWSLKGIVEYTQQPVAYAKEMLTELCDYIPRGPYKSMYQLKEEYKFEK